MLYKHIPAMGALLVTMGISSTASSLIAQPSQATIEVSEASYGLNCRNDMAGNATTYVKDECNGKHSCSFPVQKAAQNIGDHCPGVKKEFVVTYVCGDQEKKVKVEGEAVGQTAFLTCSGS
jgi:Galactose binding lectin domain